MRRRFLKYLSGLIDLKSTSQLTLIDTGWKGTIQGAMQMLFYMEGYPITIHGLYLGTTDSSHNALLQGFIREGYLLKGGFPKNAVRPIRSGAFVLEHVATANLEPLVDFDDEGHIISKTINTPKLQKKQVQLVHQGIEAFCKEAGQSIQTGAVPWTPASEPLAEQLRHILMRSTSMPTALEASRLGIGSMITAAEKMRPLSLPKAAIMSVLLVICSLKHY